MNTLPPLRVVEVCAGIGGISLGLEMTGGFETAAFVERDPYARSVLKRHWPAVPQYGDIRSVSAWNLPAAEVLAGGIPCQPHSLAGQRKAGADERDLWPEFYRLVCEIRPAYALVENVPGLRSSDGGRFFGRVLRDLAQSGYDAEWVSLSAADVGAPHKRERVWIVAYPQRGEFQRGRGSGLVAGQARTGQAGDEQWQRIRDAAFDCSPTSRAAAVADPERQSLALGQSVGRGLQPQQPAAQRGGGAGVLCNAPGAGPSDGHAGAMEGRGGPAESERSSRWSVEPDMGRAFDGLSAWVGDWERGAARTTVGYPGRVDQLRCLGNAVLPQCAYVIGRYILEHYHQSFEWR